MLTNNVETPAPAGFEMAWWGEGTLRLALPIALAERETARRIQARKDEERAKKLERERMQQEYEAEDARRVQSAGAKVSHETAWTATVRSLLHMPAPDQHVQVIPNGHDLLAQVDDPAFDARTADGDVRARRKAVRKQVLELGVHRAAAVAFGWQTALEKLEAEMPNFHRPIEMIRNTLALVEKTGKPQRVAPMLLLGPPGIGKTHFSRKVADAIGVPFTAIGFDKPSPGCQLHGTDSHWSNTATGVLFNEICLGAHANPVILLDEIDKARSDSSRQADPLGQLHSALESASARHTVDVSAEIEFDASYVTYIATANTLADIGAPILSRFEVFDIAPPDARQGFHVAALIVKQVLDRLELAGQVDVQRSALCVLGHLSPRLMHRTVEKAVAGAVANHLALIGEEQIWAAAGLEDERCFH